MDSATTFVFEPPTSVIYFAIGISIVVVIAFFVRRVSPIRKLIGLVVVAASVPLLITPLYRTTALTVDDVRIYGNFYGAQPVMWADIKRATYIAELSTSKYRPTNRTAGRAIGKTRFGRFKLANGNSALVALGQLQGAVLIETGDTTYLFGPKDIDGLASAVANHVPLLDWNARKVDTAQPRR